MTIFRVLDLGFRSEHDDDFCALDRLLAATPCKHENISRDG